MKQGAVPLGFFTGMAPSGLISTRMRTLDIADVQPAIIDRFNITTDHGAVLGKRAALVYGNRDTSSSLRYKFGLNLDTDAKQAVRPPRPVCR